jgi:hypothetical protein
MIAYKIKNAVLEQDENGFNFIKIKMVEKFEDGKYVKFISLKEAVKYLNNAVIYEDNIDSIKSKTEIKKEKKQKYKQNLMNSVLLNM